MYIHNIVIGMKYINLCKSQTDCNQYVYNNWYKLYDNYVILCYFWPSQFWYSWRFQLKEFSRNYRVVAVDLRYSNTGKVNYTLYNVSCT